VEDTRSYISGNVITLAATDSIKFERDALHYCARSGAETTAVSCPSIAALPVGLQFILDNTRGSDTMTLTPTGGTPVGISAGGCQSFLVSAAGTFRIGDLA
jgi:hypothetical protein